MRTDEERSAVDDPNTICAKCGHNVKPNYRTCPKCEGDRNRAHVERLAEKISDAKALMTRNHSDDEERNMLAQLVALDHPHPKELLRAFVSGKK